MDKDNALIDVAKHIRHRLTRSVFVALFGCCRRLWLWLRLPATGSSSSVMAQTVLQMTQLSTDPLNARPKRSNDCRLALPDDCQERLDCWTAGQRWTVGCERWWKSCSSADPVCGKRRFLSGLFKRSLARLPLYCRLTVLWRDPKIETLINQMTGNLWPTKRQKLICQLRLLQRCRREENTKKRFDTLSTEKELPLLFQLRQWQTGER